MAADDGAPPRRLSQAIAAVKQAASHRSARWSALADVAGMQSLSSDRRLSSSSSASAPPQSLEEDPDDDTYPASAKTKAGRKPSTASLHAHGAAVRVLFALAASHGKVPASDVEQVEYRIRKLHSWTDAVEQASGAALDEVYIQHIREHVLAEFGLDRFSHSGHFITKLPVSSRLSLDMSCAYSRKLTRAADTLRVPHTVGRMMETANSMQRRICRLEKHWQSESMLHTYRSTTVDDDTTNPGVEEAEGNEEAGEGATGSGNDGQDGDANNSESTTPPPPPLASALLRCGTPSCSAPRETFLTVRVYYTSLGAQTRPRYTCGRVGRSAAAAGSELYMGQGPNGGHLGRGLTWRDVQSQRGAISNASTAGGATRANDRRDGSVTNVASVGSGSGAARSRDKFKQRMQHLQNPSETLPELMLDGHDLNRLEFVRARRDSEVCGFLGECIDLGIGCVIANGFTHAHMFDNMKTYERADRNFAQDEAGRLTYPLTMDPRCPAYQLNKYKHLRGESPSGGAQSDDDPVLGAPRDFFNYFGSDSGDDGIVWTCVGDESKRQLGMRHWRHNDDEQCALIKRAVFRDSTGRGPTLTVTSELVLSSETEAMDAHGAKDAAAGTEGEEGVVAADGIPEGHDTANRIHVGRTRSGSRFFVYALTIEYQSHGILGLWRQQHAHHMFVVHIETMDQSPACLTDPQVSTLLDVLLLTKRASPPFVLAGASEGGAPSGDGTLIHCAGGIGRTGNLAFGLLDLFMTCPANPIHRLEFLRGFRPAAVQCTEQLMDGVMLQHATLRALQLRSAWRNGGGGDHATKDPAYRFALAVHAKLSDAMRRARVRVGGQQQQGGGGSSVRLNERVRAVSVM